jgi:hypothetical protein
MTLEPLLAGQSPLPSPAKRITKGSNWVFIFIYLFLFIYFYLFIFIYLFLSIYFTDGGLLLYWVISALRRDVMMAGRVGVVWHFQIVSLFFQSRRLVWLTD